mgnify:CR=1 FL=1|jgi:hypothetical protein
MLVVLGGGCCSGILAPSFPGADPERVLVPVAVGALSSVLGLIVAVRLVVRGQSAFAIAFLLVSLVVFGAQVAMVLTIGTG